MLLSRLPLAAACLLAITPISSEARSAGVRADYEFAYRNFAVTNSLVLPAEAVSLLGSSRYETEWRGQITFRRVIDSTNETIIEITARPDTVVFRQNSVRAPAQENLYREALAGKIFMVRSGDGPVSIRLDPKLSAGQKAFWKAWLATMQWTVPADLTRRSGWTAVEVTPNGDQRVRYRRMTSRSPYRILKTFESGSGDEEKSIRPGGKIKLLWENDLELPVEIAGTESYVIRWGTRDIAHSVSIVHLRLIRSEPLTSEEGVNLLLDSTRCTGLPESLRVTADEAKMNRLKNEKILAGHSRSSLREELQSHCDGRDTVYRRGLLLHLRALFALEPEAMKEYGIFLRECPVGSQAFTDLVAAYRTAGGETGLLMLLDIVVDSPRMKERTGRILRELMEIEQPGLPATTILLDHSRNDPAAQELVVLGAWSRRVDTADPDLARRIRARLGESYRRAPSLDERVAALTALGNAADSASLREFIDRSSDTEPRLRSAAILALRYFPGITITRHILAALGDQDPRVRQAAATAIGFRTLNAAARNTLRKLIRKEEIPAVKRKLQAILNEEQAGR